VNGEAATAADLAHLALVNYGAFTSMQVEDGAVRGLDLHLARLEAWATELFGEPVGEDRLREPMRRAISGQGRCSMRINLFAPEITVRDAAWRGRPSVLTTVSPPASAMSEAVRLSVQTYAREAPHLKHVATFGLIRARRRAFDDGYDDVLFADADGLVSEGSIWNIGFLQGDRVVWPRAAMLAGTGQALIERGLATAGLTSDTREVAVGEIAGFDGAFICNSATPAAPVAVIGDQIFAVDQNAMERLRHAWASNPPQAI
jgi:branched-subunit amino acid aminotransferase/4-amino-4-deoxychorismate lyase